MQKIGILKTTANKGGCFVLGKFDTIFW